MKDITQAISEGMTAVAVAVKANAGAMEVFVATLEGLAGVSEVDGPAAAKLASAIAAGIRAARSGR